MKKIVISLLALTMFYPLVSQAAVLPAVYPRIADYFLKWEINDAEAKELAKWNLLILDMEVQTNSQKQILEIRKLNPHIIILAYVNSVELIDNVGNYRNAIMRNRLASGLNDAWWLKDQNGNKISNWPGSSMFNLTDEGKTDANGNRFNNYLPNFVVNEIKSSGLWDGVFYDNTWGNVSQVNSGNIDANGDKQKDVAVTLDSAWAAGFKKVLASTRELAGNDFIIVGNGRVYEGYQKLLNGMMLEDFPSSWENGGTWAGSIKTYFHLPSVNVLPNISVINSFDKNQVDYRYFRYGLTSTLMGNGFYSFDYDTTDHSQFWWYDEYGFNLGPAISGAYNLLDSKGTDIKNGLWRRDFKYGSAIVNSTDKEQLYVFSKEEMEKMKGIQDPSFNTGLKINYLKLAARDGAVLLRRSSVINNAAFANGYFYRMYNLSGKQVKNGFFPYLSNFPGEQEIIVASPESEIQDVNLTAGTGLVTLQKGGKNIAAFYPYTKNYKGKISLTAKIDQGYIRQIITGTAIGGGPQVGIFSPTGKAIGSFFAYDKKSRGGVNVAFGDTNNDGQDEIITGPGVGLEPLIKIFAQNGTLKNSFLAYDKSFKGGVNVAIGDINNDGHNEIIVAPESGGGPQIRIFNSQGKAIGSFFAYDKSYHGGVQVGVSDVNGDGTPDILTGIKNFY
jgi:hypothetical protein